MTKLKQYLIKRYGPIKYVAGLERLAIRNGHKIGRATLSRVINGKGNPTKKTMEIISSTLKKPISKLFT